MDNNIDHDAGLASWPASPGSIENDPPMTITADADADVAPTASIAIEKLDPKGDLILAFGQYRLLVSSRVMELSCPFFNKMLQTGVFLEGVEQPDPNDPPTKTIDEDQTELFYLICRVLHYLPVERPDILYDYGLLADLCSFYGCARPLAFHVQAWIKQYQLSALAAGELQKLLWAAFVFQLRDEFQHISIQLAAALTTVEWKSWDVHPMPAHLKDDMIELFQNTKTQILQHVEDTFNTLTNSNDNHVGTRIKFCRECGSEKPLPTKKCGNCGSREFIDFACTKQIRLSAFIDFLRTQGQWPLSQLSAQSCRSFLKPTLYSWPFATPCGLDSSCPIASAIKAFSSSQGSIIGDMGGLKLENYDA